MNNDDLLYIVQDPDLTTVHAARALIELAESVSGRDDDIAGDVVLRMTELLRPGQRVRLALSTHPTPCPLLIATAKNEAAHARQRAGRMKRQIPLVTDGDLASIEPSPTPYRTSLTLFDHLLELGWTKAHLETLAIPRQRAGRSIHPGIEAGLEKLAACYGVTRRCPGCPTEFDLLRVDLRGPASWPILVPVLREWGWQDDIIGQITTSPANIAHWRTAIHRPPARQERRMIEVARRMRWEPWLLQDTDLIRDMARTADKRVASPPPTPARQLETCAMVPQAAARLVPS
jgi:hypothetical protein